MKWGREKNMWRQCLFPDFGFVFSEFISESMSEWKNYDFAKEMEIKFDLLWRNIKNWEAQEFISRSKHSFVFQAVVNSISFSSKSIFSMAAADRKISHFCIHQACRERNAIKIKSSISCWCLVNGKKNCVNIWMTSVHILQYPLALISPHHESLFVY